MELLRILLIVCACCIPILGWAYAVTYFDDRHDLQGRHFLWGLLGGIVTGLTILFVYKNVDQTSTTTFFLIAFASLFLLAAIQGVYRSSLATLPNYRSSFVLSVILAFLVAILLIILKASFLAVAGGFVAALVIPALEEIGKALHAGAHCKLTKRWLLTGVYVALGFALLENITYLLSEWDTGTYIGRLVLSTPLHILATVIALSGFQSGKKIPAFAGSILIAIIFHTVYNLSLQTLFPIAVLLLGYFFAGHLYMRDFK